MPARIIPHRPAVRLMATPQIAGVGNVSTGDTTPNAFSFIDQPSVAPSTLTISAAITVSGINAPAAIYVSGTGSPAYDINGSGNFTSQAGFVNNGDTVRARNTSSASVGGVVNTTVTIGGVSDTFSITTAGSSNRTITWTPPTQNADGSALTDLTLYQLYRSNSPDSGTASLIATIDASQAYYEDNSAPAGTYYYWPIAIDSEGTPSDFPANPIVRTFS